MRWLRAVLLQKLEDETDGTVWYTDIACKLLETTTCPARTTRTTLASGDCVSLELARWDTGLVAPYLCYRLLDEGKSLRSGITSFVVIATPCTAPASRARGGWSPRRLLRLLTGRTGSFLEPG